MTRKKVLHVLQSDRFSGAENVVCQIISFFSEHNEDIEFIYSSRDGQIREVLKSRNIKFIPIEKLSYAEMKRVINYVKPDIIHAHDMRASFFVALTCESIPFISHIHVNWKESRKLSLKSLLYCMPAFKSKHIFWVSKSSYEDYFFKKLFENKSSILKNVVNSKEILEKASVDSNSYDFDVVFIGRLTEQKDPYRLLEIFYKVLKILPERKFAIVGTGNLLEQLIAKAKMLNIHKSVYFLGFQSNPLKILQDSKLMILTSRWEGTPMCALEAMCLGIPIISTPTDGLCDLITNEYNGCLSNDNDILVKRIIELLENETLYQAYKQNTIRKFRSINDEKAYFMEIKKVYEYYL